MKSRISSSLPRGIAILVLLALISSIAGPVSAATVIARVSVDSSGTQANAGSVRGQLSADGRYVAFVSGATNLIPDDTNNVEDVFVKDRQTGATARVSVASSTGAQANNGSGTAAISSDGRYVAFYSDASNLVSGDTNGVGDIFVHDRQTGLTTRVSVDSSGHEANRENSDSYVAISGDGRYVAFPSEATNLVGGDTNNVGDIFVHDRQTGQTRRASVDSNGAEANGSSSAADLSDDGRYVTFSSGATNLVSGDTNGKKDIFVYDLQTGGTTRISVKTSGEQADGGGGSPAISGDGRYVVFLSASGNLDPRADETANKELVYVHDRQIGQTTLASVYSDGVIMTVGLFDQPTISSNGRYVAFSFYDKGNNNGIMHIWVRDLQTGESKQAAGGNDSSFGSSLSADGKIVAFWSGASNLVSGDTNGASDVFVSEIVYGPERNPTVASVTPDCGFSTPVCSYPTPSSVSFIVIFSEPVTGVSVDDFSLDMLDGITGASITGVSGYGVEYFVTVDTGIGDGKLRLNLVDNDSIMDTALNQLGGVGMGNGNFTTGKPYLIEKSVPTVKSIVRADPNPSTAETVRFTVTFSEGVWPVNQGVFVLSSTGSISGTSVTAISPRVDEYKTESTYTVTVDTGSGDGTLRLDLVDDDSIRDWRDNPLGGAGVGNGSFTTGETYTLGNSTPSVPNVTSILRADGNPTTAGSVRFTVNFSEEVRDVDVNDFVLASTGGISGFAIADVSGSGNSYLVTVNTGSGDGTLRLDLVDNDSILNVGDNPLGGTGVGNGNFSTGEIYTIDKNAPVVTGSLPADPNPTAANSVHFTVNFSEAVTGVDAGDFALTTSGVISGVAITEVSGSNATYTVIAGTGSGDGTLRLDVIDDDSIVDAGGHPLGGGGAGNGNFSTGAIYTVTKTVVTPVNLVTEIFRSNGTNDGWVLESSEDSNVGGSVNATAKTFNLGDNAKDRQYRAILHFPTFYLPDKAVVTRVILMIKKQDAIGTDPFTTHQNILVDICAGLFGFNGPFGYYSLQPTDFQVAGSRNSVGMIANNSVSGWYWSMLDNTAFPFVNLTGVTQLRLGFQLDDNDDLGDDYIRFFSGNHDGLADRPRLQVEYYLQK